MRHGLLSHPRSGVRGYVCKGGAQPGCGKTTIYAEPVEQLLSYAVLLRLASPEVAAAMTGIEGADDQAEQLREAIVDDRAQLEELAGMYADRDITAAEWKAARVKIEARIKDAERQLGRVTNTTALTATSATPTSCAPSGQG